MSTVNAGRRAWHARRMGVVAAVMGALLLSNSRDVAASVTGVIGCRRPSAGRCEENRRGNRIRLARGFDYVVTVRGNGPDLATPLSNDPIFVTVRKTGSRTGWPDADSGELTLAVTVSPQTPLGVKKVRLQYPTGQFDEVELEVTIGCQIDSTTVAVPPPPFPAVGRAPQGLTSVGAIPQERRAAVRGLTVEADRTYTVTLRGRDLRNTSLATVSNGGYIAAGPRTDSPDGTSTTLVLTFTRVGAQRRRVILKNVADAPGGILSCESDFITVLNAEPQTGWIPDPNPACDQDADCRADYWCRGPARDGRRGTCIRR